MLPLINKCSAACTFLGHDHCGGGGTATNEDAWSLGNATNGDAWSIAAALIAAFVARAFATFSLRLLMVPRCLSA